MPSTMQVAVLAKDVEGLRRAVGAGGADKPDTDGYTPLYFACMKPAVPPKVIEDILAMGASVDAKGSDGETPLYIAVFNNRVDIAKLLLSHKANVNGVNGLLKETALHAAARFGHEQAVTLLLKSGADVNARNTRMETPLFAAAKAGRHDTACLLLEAGANASIANEDGKSPLYIASEKDYRHVVIVLKADPKHLRHAKAEADAELRRRPMPVSSTDEMTERAAVDEAFTQEVRRRSSLPPPEATKPATGPMEVVNIHVPQPKLNAIDPFTGKSNGPCRSLEEVGYDMPPEIPKELQNRPPLEMPRVGGTSMIIGTGTEEGGRAPVRVDELDGEPSMEFYVAHKK